MLQTKKIVWLSLLMSALSLAACNQSQTQPTSQQEPPLATQQQAAPQQQAPAQAAPAVAPQAAAPAAVPAPAPVQTAPAATMAPAQPEPAVVTGPPAVPLRTCYVNDINGRIWTATATYNPCPQAFAACQQWHYNHPGIINWKCMFNHMVVN